MFKLQFALFTLALPLLLSACHRADISMGTNEAFIVPTDPTSCDSRGESFGIVNGQTLASNNILSESTVLLVRTNTQGTSTICTGTLIDKDKVLTAAHCTKPDAAGSISVIFSHNSRCSPQAVSRNSREVISQSIYPEYTYGYDPVKKASSDLAVLKFAGEVPAGFKVRELPSATYALSDAPEIIMTGYGAIHEQDDQNLGILRFTRAPSSRLSSSFYSSRSEQVIPLQDVHVIDQPDTGVCYGDSGGPLYTWNGKSLILIGVSSTGVDNRNPGRFAKDAKVCHGVSLFVDLRKKLDWLEKTKQSL